MGQVPSNPTKRVVDVLDFLARQSGRAYTLSELSREVGISKSTLHPLLETLIGAGYLLRDEQSRRIELGPVLSALGHASRGRRGPMIDAVRPAMEKIAGALDAHCIVSADLGDWIVPLAATGDPSRVTTLFSVGGRSNPFAPPMGILFLIGRSMPEIQEWLHRGRPALGQAEIEVNLSALDLLRVNGFAAAERLNAKARLEQAIDGFHLGGGIELTEPVTELMSEMRRSHYMILDFEDERPREVDWIGIPLLDERRRVELALVALNLPKLLTGPEVLQVASQMREFVAGIPGVRLLEPTG